MCGDHQARESLGGALAVLSPPPSQLGAPSMPMAGQLVFHNRKIEGAIATYATFTADSSCESRLATLDPCLVRIHETGDLTKPAVTSPSWTTFYLRPVVGVLGGETRWSMEVELEEPVKIEVGDDGIIGRRVSLWTQQGTGPVSEGIVGYN
ncbi:hypothetical protein F5Y14DRAFT_450715 [Nemania sp. NC0429]|nr:hypothetical protein F5Y14DRAFT_450715 [Nemania sp. NC0429]